MAEFRSCRHKSRILFNLLRVLARLANTSHAATHVEENVTACLWVMSHVLRLYPCTHIPTSTVPHCTSNILQHFQERDPDSQQKALLFEIEYPEARSEGFKGSHSKYHLFQERSRCIFDAWWMRFASSFEIP